MAPDFDRRSLILAEEIREDWKPEIRQQWESNRARLIADLEADYGRSQLEQKIKNYVDLGPAPFSVVAFHNVFFRQIRSSFVMGSYYPALTGAASLGERILNHLMRLLREDFRETSDYAEVASPESFSNWRQAVGVLRRWDVFSEEVANEFRLLEAKRHKAIHFRPEVDTEVRSLALEAIGTLSAIIELQFGGTPPTRWFIQEIPYESYVQSQHEQNPFVRRIYLPQAHHVGPNHELAWGDGHWEFSDAEEYPDRSITDAEFVKCRKSPSRVVR